MATVEKVPSVPGGKGKVRFSVDRIAAPIGTNQKFRFKIEIFRADTLFKVGGKIKLTRNLGRKRIELFLLKIPAQPNTPGDAFDPMVYVAEVTVAGAFSAQPDAKDMFVLTWQKKGGAGQNPWYDLPCDEAIDDAVLP